MVLSNRTPEDEQVVLQLGDLLAARGDIVAAHCWSARPALVRSCFSERASVACPRPGPSHSWFGYHGVCLAVPWTYRVACSGGQQWVLTHARTRSRMQDPHSPLGMHPRTPPGFVLFADDAMLRARCLSVALHCTVDRYC